LTLDGAIQPMPFTQVNDILEAAYPVELEEIFRKLDEDGIPASLGQVHFGKLKEGREIAVKVQYPEIAEAVDTEMKLLGWLPETGPVSKWGFSLEDYRNTFWQNFRKELDYRQEAAQQLKYSSLASDLKKLVVPEVIPHLCHGNVLVQFREDGFSLEKAETLAAPVRQNIGQSILEHYIHMLFRQGFVHGDPHPGNMAFRQWGREKYSLILYDYGCILEVEDEVRKALILIILALRDREAVDPVACLVALGFDADKLEDIRPQLPALLQVLFEPFLTDQPFDVRHWRLSERIDQLVGELKWWFRSAAPPRLILLIRVLHGMSTLLLRLDAKLLWQETLDKMCADLYPAVREMQLPHVTALPGSVVQLDGIAEYLKVHVVKSNGNKIELTMPARVAENLENAMDETVLKAVQKQNIDLLAIQRRACKTGFVPQTLFDVKDDEREVHVWLE
jgi:predicted unusual protein kinase regulating ubiquinone biosynthesis (AarF/ABC1/UbiB family)